MQISPPLRAALQGCAVRLHMLSAPFPGAEDAVAAVAVARDPDRASIDGLFAGRKTLNAVVVLPADHHRPDTLGASLMAATLKEGGAAFLLCRRLADALKAASWCRAAAGGDE